VSIGNNFFPVLEFFYYKNAPEVVYMGNGKNFVRIDRYIVKELWSGVLRLAHHFSMIGHYTPKAIGKRIKEYRARIKMLEEQKEDLEN